MNNPYMQSTCFKDPSISIYTFLAPIRTKVGLASTNRKPLSSFHKYRVAKCIRNREERENSDSLSGMVEQLLSRDENKALLDGLEKASLRVEMAKLNVEEIEREDKKSKELRDYITELENRASEIEECQKEIEEAKAMLEEAEEMGIGVNKERERAESIKSALISALVGTVAGLPVSFIEASNWGELILPLGINFVSCALFGVTFRYIVRRDLDDNHLKTGACAAFGIVKGLGTLEGSQPLELTQQSFISHALDAALYVSQSLLVFAFAAVALDFCFKTSLLAPFPVTKSDPPSG